MAGPIVGTAYVRIEAITSGLASQVGDAWKKGAKDAEKDIAKAGSDSGDAYAKGAVKSIGDGKVGDGVIDAWDPPDASKRVSDAGVKHTDDYSEGVEKESKRRNPFQAIGDAFQKFAARFNPGASIAKALGDDDITEAAGDSGTDTNRSWWKSFTKGFKKDGKGFSNTLQKFFAGLPMPPTKLLAGLFAPDVIGGALKIVGSALAGATAAVGFLAQAALGAGAAMAGMFAVAIPGAGVLMAALKTNTEELEAFKEEAKDLGEPFKEIAVATQRTLLPALTRALKTMQNFIPLLADFGEELGGIVGHWVEMGAATLTSEKNMSSFAKILDYSTGFFDRMGEAAVTVIDALIPFFEAVAPLAVMFAESLRQMAFRFKEFMETKGTEGLATMFQDWYVKAAQVGRILGDLFVGLWAILNLAGDSDLAGDMFGGLEEAAQKFRDWATGEGQDAIQEWFDKSQPLLDEIWLLMKDIADLVIAPTFDTEGMAGVTEFVKTIRTEWLPIFESLGDQLSGQGMGDALKELAGAFVELIGAMGEGGSLTATIETFTTVMQGLADVLNSPAAQAILPYLLTFMGIMKALSMLKVFSILSSVASGITALGVAVSGPAVTGGLAAFGAGLAAIAWPLLAVAAAVAAVWAVWHFWDDINAALKSAWEWFTRLNPVLKILVGGLAALALMVMGPIAAIPATLYAIVYAFKNWREILAVLDEVWDAIYEFFTGIPELIANLPETLGNVFDTIVEFFTELPAKMAEGLSTGADALKEGLITLVGNIPGWLLTAAGSLWEVGENMLGYIADGLAKALPVIARFFGQLPGRILTFVGRALQGMVGLGINILQAVVTGLVKALPEILTFFIKLPFEIGTILRRAIVGLTKFGIQMIVALVKGAIRALPRLINWFQDLPGNIISAIGTAVDWLLDVGRDVLAGFLEGVEESWDTISEFFSNLPSNIVAFVSDSIDWLLDVGRDLMDGMWEGIQEVWASIDEFFGGLPDKILTALGDLGTTIWEGISTGFDTLKTNWLNWLTELVLAFILLPAQILIAIGDLGMTIWNWIVGGMETAMTNIDTWVDDALAAFVRFVEGIPGALGGFASTVLKFIADGVTGAFNAINNWVRDSLSAIGRFVSSVPGAIGGFAANLLGNIATGVTNAYQAINTWVGNALGAIGRFVSGIPGAIGGFASSLLSSIASGLSGAYNAINNWVSNALGAIGRFVTGIPGKLADAAGSLVSGVKNLIKNAWNSAVSGLSITIPNPLPGDNDWTISVPRMEMGGIIGGTAFGVPIVVGERFRQEAVVPITRPARAMAVMQQAGLDKMVLDAYMHGQVPGQVAAGEVTMLHIDRASFTAPVDADLVVQKITSAYRRLAS